jgi:TusA-related sulfurtransferase
MFVFAPTAPYTFPYSAMIPHIVLDAGEAGCGELTMLIARSVRGLLPGQTIEVIAYDLAAAMDIPAWCRSTGHQLVSVATDTTPSRFLIRKKLA